MNKICKDCNIERNSEFNGARCKDCHNNYMKNYMVKYRNERRVIKEKIVVDIKEYQKKYQKKYYIENKIIIGEIKKEYNKNNRDKINKYRKTHRDQNILVKLIHNLRGLIGNTYRKNGYKKNSKTANILGISYEDFQIYIQSQFESWMNWDNQGLYTGNYNETWHIDHITPISNAISEAEVIKLNHYTNFRPLCSRKNLEKSNKDTIING